MELGWEEDGTLLVNGLVAVVEGWEAGGELLPVLKSGIYVRFALRFPFSRAELHQDIKVGSCPGGALHCLKLML